MFITDLIFLVPIEFQAVVEYTKDADEITSIPFVVQVCRCRGCSQCELFTYVRGTETNLFWSVKYNNTAFGVKIRCLITNRYR